MSLLQYCHDARMQSNFFLDHFEILTTGRASTPLKSQPVGGLSVADTLDDCDIRNIQAGHCEASCLMN